MPKPVTKRRKQAQQDTPASIFDHYNAHAASIPYDNGGPKEDDIADDKYSKLEEQVKALTGTIETLQRERMAVLAAPPVKRETVPINTEVDLKGLPDPTMDPEGYAQELGKRYFDAQQRREQAIKQAQTTEQDFETRVEGLWSEFSEQYPDYAKDQKRVEFVTSQVIQRAKQKGLDPERYMFVTRDTFLGDVAKEYEKVFNVETDDGDDDYVDEPAPRGRRAQTRRGRERDDDDDGRSAGIHGGLDSGFRPSASRNGRDTGPDMIADLHELQKKSGYY